MSEPSITRKHDADLPNLPQAPCGQLPSPRTTPAAIACLLAALGAYLGAGHGWLWMRPEYGMALALSLALAAAGLLCLTRGGERPFVILVGLLVIVSVFRVWFVTAGPYDLSGDEAHYWEWSRRLDWNYYSKGPIVAWLIRAGTLAFGDTNLGVRSPCILLSFATSLVLYSLGRRMYNAKVGACAAGLMQITPIYVIYGSGMTIDPPLLLCWALSLLLLRRAMETRSAAAWLALGVCIGVGMLSKYTMAFFYISTLLYLATSAEGRKHLRTPWPYLAVALSLAFMAPVLAWNAQHGWANFRHNLMHTRYDEGMHIRPMFLLEFIGGQFAVITPILLAFILLVTFLYRKTDRMNFWFAVPMLAFFLAKSIQGRVHENWALPAYLTGFITVSAFMVDRWPTRNIHLRRLLRAGIIIPFAVAVALHLPIFNPVLHLFGWNLQHPPLYQITGWKELGQEVSRVRDTMPPNTFIVSDRYMVSSELAFYMPGQPVTYCTGSNRRMNQYDLWDSFEGRLGQDAIMVTFDNGPQLLPNLQQAFKSWEYRQYVAHDCWGYPIRSFEIFICHGFTGMKRFMPEKY